MKSLNFAQWQKRAADAVLPHQALIHGEQCSAISGETFTRVNPATGQSLVEIANT